MANLIINDILDELREENNRLFNENKVIYDLLDKYRNLSLTFQKSCNCNQKSNNDFVIKSLEEEYQRFEKQKQIDSIKTEGLDIICIKNDNKRAKRKSKPLKTIKKPKTGVKDNKIRATPLSDIIGEDNDPFSEESNGEDGNYSSDDSNGQLKRQKTTDSKEELFCCGEEFGSKTSLKTHITRYHTIERPFKCQECDKSYVSKNNLKAHQKIHSSISEGTVFECRYEGCGQRLRSNNEREEHVRRQHTFEKPFKCQECDKSFYAKRNLKTHQLIHSKEEVFQCDLCDKTFGAKRGLLKHKRQMHSLNPIIYKCEYCPLQSRFQGTIRSHTQRVHLSAGPTIKCDFNGCDKKFRHIGDLKRHQKGNHTGPEIVCDWPGCGHVFRVKQIYEDHKRSHLGVREFKCDFEGCGKSFIMAKTLGQHKRSHQKKYVCSWPECELRFSSNPLLKAHMNSHLNLRPFKCYIDNCVKDFKAKPHLDHHIRTSHKTKPIPSN